MADSLNERLQLYMPMVTEEEETWRSVTGLGKAVVGREGPPTFYDGVAVGAGEWGGNNTTYLKTTAREEIFRSGRVDRISRRVL